MQEGDFYTVIREHVETATKPFTVIFTELSLSKNEGGAIGTLENVVKGPLRKNQNQRYMIGLKKPDGQVVHIYLHTILELVTATGLHYKLKLN